MKGVEATHDEGEVKAIVGEYIRDNIDDLPAKQFAKALSGRRLASSVSHS
jgi:hypothetical protein